MGKSPVGGRGALTVSIIWKRWPLSQGLGQQERSTLLLLVWPSKMETGRYELSALGSGLIQAPPSHMDLSLGHSDMAPFSLSQLSPDVASS